MERAAKEINGLWIVLFAALILLGISCSRNTDDNHEQTNAVQDSIPLLRFVNEALDEDSHKLFSLEIIDQNMFYSGQPGEEMKQDSSIRKQIDAILVPLSSGAHLKLQDAGNLKSDNYTIYQYKGKFNTIPYYLVSSEGYESYGMILMDKDNGEQHGACDKSVVSPKLSYLVGTPTYSEEAFVNDPYFRISFDFLSDKKINGKSQSVVIDMSQLRGQYQSFPEDCELSWENENSLLIMLNFKSNNASNECYLRLTKLQ